MSWSLPPDDILNESGHTDNAGDQSNESDGGVMFNASEYRLNAHAADYYLLQDTNTSFGEICHLYNAERTPSSPAYSPSKQEFESPNQQYRHETAARIDTIDERFESNWTESEYKVESPSLRDNWLGRTDTSSPFFESSDTHTEEKNWPSLQIICPEPPHYNQQADYQSMDSVGGGNRQYPYMYPPIGSPSRGGRSAVLGAPHSERPMSYYPPSVVMADDNPLSYNKMGCYPYSPAMRHAGAGGGGAGAVGPSSGGYRSTMYGTPRGPMSMMSPHRTPTINRRFMEPIDGYIYQVQFKRAHKNFILAPSAPRNIIPGDFVKVEADRGEDMGILLSKSPASDFEEVMPTAGYRGRGFSSGQGERKFLFRLANAEERAALVGKVQDEERALEVIRSKVMEQMLPMTILDAEYQFDRHKLTYYFEADRRIDFRELVSELFSMYKTRIWMQQVDTSVLGMNDAGLELAKATGFLPERDDHAYLATSHMHRSEGLHDGGHSFSGGGGGGGGYAGHSDTRSLQYSSPQLSQHHQPPQHMGGQSPGQRVDSGFQSPLYGGAASTWGSPHAQQYQPSFGQPSMGGARASPGYGQIGGQMRNEPNRNLMSPQDQLASSGTGNTGFAYGSAGLLDTPLAPLTRPQPPVMRPTRMQPVAPYPAMQPSPGLYQVGTAVAPPPAPQGSQLLQQPYFGNYGPPQQAAVTTGPQDDFYASYFQPAAAPRTPDAYGGSQRQDTTYYPPLESHYSTRNQHDQYIQEEQPFSASSAPTSAATGGNSGGGGAIDEGGGEDGQKDEGDGDLEGGGVEDSASLNTLIEQWSLRDPR